MIKSKSDETSAVKVAVRIRNKNESEKNSKIITNVVGNTITIKSEDDQEKSFTYNYVYDIGTKQEKIYEDIGQQVVNNAHKGYNGCVFAYGQTGCFVKDTPIMLYSGMYKPVQNITTQDTIMGDDSTPRKVLKLIQGTQDMYDIYDADTNQFKYCVNLDHIMVFKKFKDFYTDQMLDMLHSKCDTSYFDMLDHSQIYEIPLADYFKMPDKHRYACYMNNVKFSHVPDKNLDEITMETLSQYIKDCLFAQTKYQMELLNYITESNIPVILGDYINLQFIAKCNGKILSSKSLLDYYNNHILVPYKTHFRPLIKKSQNTTYYGFMLNNNHRFIGAGFNVLRNSGKTYSMMGGEKTEMGLIPRICIILFKQTMPNVTYRIELSYLEIYSETIRDLLNKDIMPDKLRVRSHPEYGPFVENLSQHAIDSPKALMKFIEKGNKERTVAATALNDTSSRSHAVLIIHFTQIIKESEDTIREITSRINLVDLAGSEKILKSEVTGINREEAININVSLSTLGRVIQALSKNSSSKRKEHVPFRDSILTMILTDSLGGNSKTFMLATISPSIINYHETISTLRYARSTQNIVNSVRINQTSNDELVLTLRKEIDELRKRIKNNPLSLNTEETKKLQEELNERTALMKEREKTWEQKEAESKRQLEEFYKKELTTKNTEVEAAKKAREEAFERLNASKIEHQRDKDDFEKNKIATAIKESQQYINDEIRKIEVKYETKYEDKIRELNENYAVLQKKYTILETIYNEKQEEYTKLQEQLTDMHNNTKQLQHTYEAKLKNLQTDRTVLTRQIQHLQSKLQSMENNVDR